MRFTFPFATKSNAAHTREAIKFCRMLKHRTCSPNFASPLRLDEHKLETEFHPLISPWMTFWGFPISFVAEAHMCFHCMFPADNKVHVGIFTSPTPRFSEVKPDDFLKGAVFVVSAPQCVDLVPPTYLLHVVFVPGSGGQGATAHLAYFEMQMLSCPRQVL